jgi:hypothetical protein
MEKSNKKGKNKVGYSSHIKTFIILANNFAILHKII